MTRREHGFLTAAALGGLLLAAYQCWYVYLPEAEAQRFDLCQFSRTIDCFQSMHRFGGGMTPFGIPVFAALLALFALQAGLLALAWAETGAGREAHLAWGRLLALPLAGLAAYVLMHDYLVAQATSASAILVGALALGGAIHLVLRSGIQGAVLRVGATGGAALALAAFLLGFFVHGAGAARQEIERVELERAAKPPLIRWADFARDLPRRHAAMLGNPVARHEVLLFVDPRQEESRAVLRAAAELDPGPDSDWLLVFYAPGDHGAALVQAAAQGRLKEYLRAPEATGDLDSARPIVERQQRAMRALGIDRYPTALWKGGSKQGPFRLAEILRALR